MAAEHIYSPEGRAAPPGDYDSWDEYMRDIELMEVAGRDDEAQRGLKAMRLAPNLAVYGDLLAGRKVFKSALDPYWRKRYGL